MAKICFLGPIKKDSIELDIKNLRELKNILQKDEQLKDWLEKSAISINDNIAKNLDEKIKKRDIVSILPPVCGG